MKLLLSREETSAAVSLSASTIQRMIKDNRFPRPVNVGSRVLWRADDLQTWAKQLQENTLPPPSKKRGRPRLAI